MVDCTHVPLSQNMSSLHAFIPHLQSSLQLHRVLLPPTLSPNTILAAAGSPVADTLWSETELQCHPPPLPSVLSMPKVIGVCVCVFIYNRHLNYTHILIYYKINGSIGIQFYIHTITTIIYSYQSDVAKEKLGG